MKPNTPLRLLALAAIAGALTTAVVAEPKAGGTVYSKRNGLSLYAGPNSQSAVAGSVGFAEALKISEINPTGKWLNVTASGGSGWVFAGFTAEKKPEAEKTAGIGSVDASSSTTAAAARPLSPEAEAYADRHNLGAARDDVNWSQGEAHKVTQPIVDSYMRENKKGEYQE
jgi:uncharacterized protein YgiM (DUF1202 family)